MPQIRVANFRIVITVIIAPEDEEFLDLLNISKNVMEEWSSEWYRWDVVELIYTRMLLVSLGSVVEKGIRDIPYHLLGLVGETWGRRYWGSASTP